MLSHKIISRATWVLAAASLLIAAGCQPKSGPNDGQSSDPVNKQQGSAGVVKPSDEGRSYTPLADGKLEQAYNGFGFELFRKMAAASPSDNLFISPPSVSLALSMTMNGAVGATREGMAQTLQLQGLDPSAVNESTRQLQQQLKQTDPGLQLSIANSIWARKGVKFDPTFLSTNKTYYDAETTTLDFADKKAADTINKWVDKETKGKIKQIVSSPIDADSVMFLINAIYFKADWTVPFEKLLTSDRPFTLSDGSSANRSMMTRTGTYEFADRDGYNAVRLPYGNGNTGMVVLLPDEGTKLSALEDRLTAAEWEKLTAALKSQQGEVIMPRFKLEYEASLRKPLEALGMKQAFASGQADFSALLLPPDSANISEVKHKTFVQVDEKGTEAAAVTSVTIKASGAAITNGGFRMEMNRPFLVVLHDRLTGVVLFVGAIMDPKL